MNNQLKRILRKVHSILPAGAARVARKSYYAIRLSYHEVKDGRPQEVFKKIYNERAWGPHESVSGPGSTLKITESNRSALAGLIREHGVSRFLDAPCGDYNWFRLVAREPEFSYIGGDIVPELVERNQASFGAPGTRFVELDITKDPLPDVDLWMCREDRP